MSFELVFLFDWAKRFEMPLDAIYQFTSKNGLIDWFCSLRNKSAIVNQLAPSLETIRTGLQTITFCIYLALNFAPAPHVEMLLQNWQTNGTLSKLHIGLQAISNVCAISHKQFYSIMPMRQITEYK